MLKEVKQYPVQEMHRLLEGYLDNMGGKPITFDKNYIDEAISINVKLSILNYVQLRFLSFMQS